MSCVAQVGAAELEAMKATRPSRQEDGSQRKKWERRAATATGWSHRLQPCSENLLRAFEGNCGLRRTDWSDDFASDSNGLQQCQNLSLICWSDRQVLEDLGTLQGMVRGLCQCYTAVRLQEGEAPAPAHECRSTVRTRSMQSNSSCS